MNGNFSNSDGNFQKAEDPDALFDLLNLSPPADFHPNPFEAGSSRTPPATGTTPAFIQQEAQQFQPLNDIAFHVESPISEINSPVDVFSSNGTNTYQHNDRSIQELLKQQQQLQQAHLAQQVAHLQQQQQASQSQAEARKVQLQQQAQFQQMQYQQQYQQAQQQQQQQQQAQAQYQSQLNPQDASVPSFYFDTPSQDHLIPNSNNLYPHANNNNSTSNLTVISNQSYVSASQDPPTESRHDLAASLLSPYESAQYGSLSPAHSVSRPASPFLSTSPYSENNGANNDDDNLSIYQTIENLTIDAPNNGSIEFSQTEKAAIEKEFLKQESNLQLSGAEQDIVKQQPRLPVPEIFHQDADQLTEDNLNNNNTMLQHTPPVTIKIQAPEEIAAHTPSLFSQSNSQRSSPANSPKATSRSSSFGNKERPHLGDSLVPSFSIKDSSTSSPGVKEEVDEDENLLRPGDGDFQRMRHGRRLSNASRSRSRSRSRSVDSRKSDISDPSKNREKMIELAAPQSNKRTQKHPSVHACHLCDKTFTRPYNLKSHLRTHTDERPFICSTCGKAFARQHDKKRHEDLHTGEKRFQCRGLLFDGVTEWGCGKRFARADALGRHFKTESGRECVRPLLEDDRRRKAANGEVSQFFDIKEQKITDDMLDGFDFNEIFASQMGRDED